MKIKQKTIELSEMTIERIEFEFWDTFCDEFIERCRTIINSPNLPASHFENFTMIKEELERIQFNLDVFIGEEITLEITYKHVSLFNSLMKNWVKSLESQSLAAAIKMKNTNNGENKRQFQQTITKCDYLLKHIRNTTELLTNYKNDLKR